MFRKSAENKVFGGTPKKMLGFSSVIGNGAPRYFSGHQYIDVF